MATIPKLNYPDGSGTTTGLTITTNVSEMSFSGTVDANTVDIQIDVNGSGFVSDPTLVEISAGVFRVPNSSSFPDGFQFEHGENSIRLRAVDLSGGVSPPAVISVSVFTDDELGVTTQSPTGVVVNRRAKSVDICWSDVMTEGASGYNIYAATGSGGTGSGYLKVNKDMISVDSPTVSEIYENPVGNFQYELPEADGSSDLQIVTDTTDPANGEVIERKSVNWISLVGQSRYKLSVDVVATIPVKRFVFNHDRARGVGSGIMNSDVFGTVGNDDPLFYVVTALYFDVSTGGYLESRFSQELSAAPLPLDKTVRGINIRNQSTVARDYIEEVQKAEPVLSLIPGSTVREVHIEPFANEAQRVYFLLDFVHRAKSFTALLAVDDPNSTGTSIPVDNSQYKSNLRSALNLADNTTTQSLIDGAFDSLAQNFGVPRQGARAATVVQTFYTTILPTRDLLVSQNASVSSSIDSTAPRFVSRGAVFMYANRASQYWNVEKSRYEVKVEMIAESPGSAGNVSANVLDTVVSGATGLKTLNEQAANFGRDAQSNLELAESAMLALTSLDTGTEGGYYKSAVSIPGVLEVKIVKSGDPFMMRDWDPVRGKHVGGKVDVYVKGTIERTIVESFAFQFTIAKNVRFEVVDATALTFRALDSRLTPSNPIQEIMNNPSQDLGVRNHSTTPTQSYDLTGAIIVNYNTIQLNSAIPQPVTMFDDFVEGDYRYRSNNQFIASVQPIRRVSSVVGEVSGTLDSTLGYDLYKTQDPLLEGESSLAKDYVSINQVDGIPAGNMVQVNDEQHVLIGQFEEPMGSVGINSLTLSVYSRDRLIEYQGPNSANPDYLIVEGTQTTASRIVRTALSNIDSGDTVSIDYQHDENFYVTYVVNDVVQRVASVVSNMRHVTADVAVKQSLDNPVSMETIIQLLPNSNQSTVDSNVRTSLTRLTDLRGLGNPIHQSDATGAIEAIFGVDYLVQPLSRFTLQTGAYRIREKVYSDYEFMPGLSYGANAVYILTQPLPFNTTDGGGPNTLHVGVYLDEQVMTKAPSLYDVGRGYQQWWVIGRLGAVIIGYSDDDTLYPDFLTAEAVEAERVRRTANKVVVSLDASVTPFDTPDNHSFAATYIVENDKGVKDISVSPIEYLTIGDVTLTYKSA
jgi:hypothetical protein